VRAFGARAHTIFYDVPEMSWLKERTRLQQAIQVLDGRLQPSSCDPSPQAGRGKDFSLGELMIHVHQSKLTCERGACRDIQTQIDWRCARINSRNLFGFTMRLSEGQTNDPRNHTNQHETQQPTDGRSSSSFDTDSKWPRLNSSRHTGPE
jgi:hypothetical protein